MRQTANSALSTWDLVYVIAIGLSAWNLYVHPSPRPGVIAWRVGIIVFCVLALLVRLLGGGGRRQAAERILANQKAIYGEQHEYAFTSIDQFPYLDRSFYDGGRAWAEAQGFVFLGDRENVTLTRVFPAMRTCIRSLVGDGGTIVMGLYHVARASGGPRSDLRITEFETGFSDGTFLTTSNAEAARTLPCPGVDAQRNAYATPPEQLLAAHRQRVQQRLAGEPHLRAGIVRTPAELIAFQQRMQALKIAHRRQIGFTNAEELAQIQGRPLNEAEAGVAAHLEALKREQGLQSPPPPNS